MENVKMRVTVTPSIDFLAVYQEREDSKWEEVLIGTEGWNTDMSEELQILIKEHCETLLMGLNRNLSLFNHLIKE